MHTKKTNNTNKLMQISYHSVLTKIQKLQNLKKKKKKKLFSVPTDTPDTSRYCPKLVGTAGTRPVRPVFFPVRNRGVECTGLLAGTVYSSRTGRYGTELITLEKREEREMEEKRENWFVYIICWYSLYYFNELYVKIKTRMLDELQNEMVK